MKRLFVSAVLAAACSSTPQTRPHTPETSPVAQTPPSPSNPPGAATAGTPSPAPPAAGQPAAPTAPPPGESASAQAKAEPPPIDDSAMDKSADPCTDFYQYACGSWLKTTPIPEDRPVWSRGFSEIFQRNEAVLRQILEKDAKGEPDSADPFAKKVGDFYTTCMDEHKAETASFAGLQDELARIDDVRDARALARVVASTATQSRPKCWLTVTTVMAERNSSRQAMNTPSGSLVNSRPSSKSRWMGWGASLWR